MAMGRVPAGSLNKRIKFQRKVFTQDNWGQPQDVWEDLPNGEVWANIRFQTGMSVVNHEFQSGGLEVAASTASFRIRKREDINATMRILYRSRTYDIRDVLPDEMGEEYLDVVAAVGLSVDGG